MFDSLKRLFKTAQAETNAAIDKFQDPIKMAEQGIRDLKSDLSSSLQALAEVKATLIGNQKRLKEAKDQAADYEKKAMLLLQKAQQGNMELVEAERLATEALNKKEESMQQATRLAADIQNQEQLISNLESKIKKLKAQINSWEGEMTILKARAKTAKASKKINKHLAKIDSNGTITMLERMKERVDEDESLSQAYEDVGSIDTSIDNEIDKALSSGAHPNASASLEEMKKKLGMTQ